MPNPSKGARLWLRPAAADREATWIIRDGAKSSSTGCGAEARGRAEEALRDYLAAKHTPATTMGASTGIPVADVLAIYAKDRGPRVANPRDLAGRLSRLLGFFGGHTLGGITPHLCRQYSARRGDAAARRELEDLRAAIRHHWKLGFCDRETRVELPPKSFPRERWLTRDEAARLLRATRNPYRRHVARFVLVGLYTGTRASAICTASIRQEEGRGFVDLVRGVFYRLPKGKRQTNKRQPTIRIPPRLLAHMRRWPCANAVVEYEGRPVASIKKAFSHSVREAGLQSVTQHTLRHTAITWAMQNGADPYQAAGFFGVSLEVLLATYGHHHPDYQSTVGIAVTARPAQVRHKFTGAKGEDRAQT